MKEFKESLDTAVFTTKYIMEKESSILFVFHDEDGSWQFHGSEGNISEEDMRLISLGEILEIDSTISELADLPSGFEAARSDINKSWKIMSSN